MAVVIATSNRSQRPLTGSRWPPASSKAWDASVPIRNIRVTMEEVIYRSTRPIIVTIESSLRVVQPNAQRALLDTISSSSLGHHVDAVSAGIRDSHFALDVMINASAFREADALGEPTFCDVLCQALKALVESLGWDDDFEIRCSRSSRLLVAALCSILRGYDRYDLDTVVFLPTEAILRDTTVVSIPTGKTSSS